MTGTRYFIMNTYTVWTLENANFNEMNGILLFRKWCIIFSLIEGKLYYFHTFYRLSYGQLNIRKLTELVNSN